MAFLDVIVGGTAGGIVATIIVGAILMGLRDDGVLPGQLLASKFLNDRPPEQNMEAGVGIVVGFGVLAGIVLMALGDLGDFHASILGMFLFGLLFGVLLSFATLAGMGLLGRISEMRDEPLDDVKRELAGALGLNLLFAVVAGLVGALIAGAL